MCNYLNVSAVKKAVNSNQRQCSPAFLLALDKHIDDAIQASCAGDAKRLEAVTVTETRTVPVVPAEVRLIRDEVSQLELQVNSITQKDYLKCLRTIRGACDKLLGT